MANIKDEFINWCSSQPNNLKNGYKNSTVTMHYIPRLLKMYNQKTKKDGKDIFNVDKNNVNDIISILNSIDIDFLTNLKKDNGDFAGYKTCRDLYAHFLIWYFKLGENKWKNFSKLSTIKSNQFYDINFNNSKYKNTNNKNSAEDEKYNRKIFKSNIHPYQLIFYGAPGTGKSSKLNKKAEVFGNNIERVTFHPSLTYGAFVGSFKPYSKDGKITYKYIAGVFIRHLVKALKNENENYLLIIEEINRANTAAVFGDMFQLLDRDENGESEYKISISDELKEHLDKESVKNLKNNKLYLPSNLYIWATMNNADQGVMPLDTAFKRRWDFEYMPLDADSEDKKLSEIEEKWNELRKNINKKLLSLGINEDKMLGFYFLNGKALENEDNYLKALQNKVLMYLYEDVLRHCRTKIFANSTFANISQMNIKDIEKLFINKHNEAE